MSERGIIVLTDVALITCIVQRGTAEQVIKAAEEAGAQGATTFYARGSGVRERLGLFGITIEAEKEVVFVVVASDQVDRVFERMYLAGELDTPGKGFIYITRLEKAATYVPDEILASLGGQLQ